MQKKHVSERGGWCQVAQLRAAYYKERIKGNDGKARELLAAMGECACLCSPLRAYRTDVHACGGRAPRRV
jgi:hypothetical protein